jgi:hypothetical protein
MAFDFGAALSSIGQIAPAMSEGAEIRRQRAADAATVAQQAQAARDTHQARLAQTEREKALTQQETRNANRLIPLSTKPERGEDGKYYMLFAGPDGRPMRLPVEGNYDPLIERRATLKELNIPENSELGKTIMLGLKPSTSQPLLKQDAEGNFEWIEKPYQGLPSSAPPGSPQSTQPTPGVIPTGVKGRTPPTGTTSTHVYHWVDNAGNVHESPYTTTTKKQYGGAQGAGSTPSSPSTAPQAGGTRAAAAPKTPGLIGNDKIIGTGKLPATAEKVIITTQPVIDQTNKLIQRIDQLGLANDNTAAYLAKPYLYYKFGKASDPGSLGNDIAALSLGSVVDAASALSGSSRSIQALKLAMVHTPNPWVDSPKLLREKLVTINSRLNDMVNEAKTAGQGSPQAPQQTIKNFVGQSKPKDEVIVVSPQDMQ